MTEEVKALSSEIRWMEARTRPQLDRDGKLEYDLFIGKLPAKMQIAVTTWLENTPGVERDGSFSYTFVFAGRRYGVTFRDGKTMLDIGPQQGAQVRYTVYGDDPRLAGRFMPYGCGFDDPTEDGMRRRAAFRNGSGFTGITASSPEKAARIAQGRGWVNVYVKLNGAVVFDTRPKAEDPADLPF